MLALFVFKNVQKTLTSVKVQIDHGQEFIVKAIARLGKYFLQRNKLTNNRSSEVGRSGAHLILWSVKSFIWTYTKE